jgi:hypothetical protein
LFDPISIASLCHQNGFHKFSARTTARGSRYILGMSRTLKDSKHPSACNIQVSLKTKITALLMQILERIMICFNPHMGEEIVLHIYKDRNTCILQMPSSPKNLSAPGENI